jgi:transposase-like protein
MTITMHAPAPCKDSGTAVDKSGDAEDFLLTAKRDWATAWRYLERAINLHGLPEKITIDKAGQQTRQVQVLTAGQTL